MRKRVFKKFDVIIGGALLATSMCFGIPVFADDAYKSRKIESVDSRAMGGLDVVVNESTPANAALSESKFKMNIAGIGMQGSVEEIAQFIETTREIEGFADVLNDPSIAQEIRYSKLVELSKKLDLDLDVKLKTDIIRTQFGGDKFGKFLIGAYIEADAGVILKAPKNLDPSMIKQDHIYLGEDDVIILRGEERADIVVYFGHGYRFLIGEKCELALGLQNRIFYRELIPETVIKFNRRLASSDDVQIPKVDMKYGIGLAFDVYNTFAFNDSAMNTKIGLNLENLYGNVRYDNHSQREATRLSIGGVIYPLYSIGFDEFGIGVDVEDITNSAIVQLGTFFRLGVDYFHITPKAGVIFNQTDVFGEDSNTLLTTGITSRLGLVNLSGLFEYNISRKSYNLGIYTGIAFGK